LQKKRNQEFNRILSQYYRHQKQQTNLQKKKSEKRMRSRQSTATIAIYFLITLLWTTLYTHASKDQNKNIIFELNNAITQTFQQNVLQLPVKTITSPFQSCNTKILSTIFNKLLTIREILTLRKTCKGFQIILLPNFDKENMVMFCKDFDSKETDDVPLMWSDLKYFLNESYTNALKNMEMWNIKQNQYAVFTRDNKIISWNNKQALEIYPKIIFNKTKNEIFSRTPKVYNKLKSAWAKITTLEYESAKIYSKGCGNAWAKIISEGNVVTNGPGRYGGDSSHVQSQLKNVKMIVSSRYAFLALLGDSSIVTWGGQYDIHQEIQPRLHNVQMVFSNNFAFAALLGNGRVISWGEEYYGGNILTQFKPNYTHVKMIFSTQRAFAALLNGGSVVAWGDEAHGGKIPESVQMELHQNVKMIFSTDYAFAALLDGGRVVTWGNGHCGGRIPPTLENHLYQNVKTIFSSSRAFAALLHNGYAFFWGTLYRDDENIFGIQTQFYRNVKIIFSNDEAFVVWLNDGQFVGWGSRRYGGEITPEIQTQLQNTKMIFSSRRSFAALLNDGSIFTWGGASIPLEVKRKNVKMIFPERNGFTALCNDGKIISWRDW